VVPILSAISYSFIADTVCDRVVLPEVGTVLRNIDIANLSV